ncbi:hypothetical protein [Paraglaciecola sp. L3A3]|uniref:hypothetical protein n=1 Tax=Paraglaciecola sp. L3A3 TaxID=2686358 RepID=UPI00131B117D|nr:hypothetical protein [Paraglaciecola sp. L3A3]
MLNSINSGNRCTQRCEPEMLVLYKSEDKLDKIVLHKSLEGQCEYVMLSKNMVTHCEYCNPLGSNILFMNQYRLLSRYKAQIERYIKLQDTKQLFNMIVGIELNAFLSQFEGKC